jgi:hypothetical protein
LLQQSDACVHAWPYWAQVGPDPVVAVAVVAPLVVAPVVVVVVVVVGLHGPQMPLVLPTAISHCVPGQQSALMVHGPQAMLHFVIPQTYGGLPLGFGTQGKPLQQFALDAHACPARTHAPVQRGTPTLSSLQVSCVSQLPLQQLQLASQDFVASLQTSPSGLQPIGLRQTPTTNGAVMLQVTGEPEPPGSPADPQQSVSFVQRSPTG